MARTYLTLGASALLLLAACGDDDGDITGIPDQGIDMSEPETDMGPPPPSSLFGPCIIDEQCQATMGPTAFCRTGPEGWPEGHCTLPCADRGPCDDGVVFNHCIPTGEGGQNICEQACSNSTDCRENYVCAGKGQIDPTRPSFGLCVGLCMDSDDCGYRSDCNPYAAECLPQGEVPTEGGRTGEACATDDACLSGNCITERNEGGTPTGWNGGTCIGNCALEPGWNSNDLYFGDAYPTGVCPDANVCYPTGELVQGSPGVCLKVCDTNADCREAEGYECSKTVQLSSGPKTFTNGICFPVDCAETPCPAGFECTSVPASGGGTRSVCAPM